MNKNKWIAGAALAIAAVAVPVTYSVAQGRGPGPGGQFTQPGAPMPPMQMMPGGGGATMISDGDFLYILQGGRLFKVDKKDLSVRATGSLPTPRPEHKHVPPPEEKSG